MRILAFTLGLFVFGGTVAQADLTDEEREAITQSVDLYEKLLVCMKSGDFQTYGYSHVGPCGSWLDEFRRVRDTQDGRAILQAGYMCIAADAHLYGLTFFDDNPDLVWREELRQEFEKCREAVR